MAHRFVCEVCDVPFVKGVNKRHCTPACRTHAMGRKPVAYDPDKERLKRAKRCKTLHNVRSRLNGLRVMKMAWEIKLASGCVDCGYRAHPVALQFDHLRDKRRKVGGMQSIKAFREEIEKCEVVCANCHAIRTFSRNRLANPAHADLLAEVLKAHDT